MADTGTTDESLDFNGASLLQRIDSPVARALCETPTFARLRRVSFLGAIDYAVTARRFGHLTTRFDHSLGVAFVSIKVAERMGFSSTERQLAAVAGLLHDIGHGPLSHSLESSFTKTFGVDHHATTNAIVAGTDRRVGGDIAKVLDRYRIDQDALLGILNRRYNGPSGRLFDSPINVDTIEGIHRTAAYLRGYRLMQSPLLVANALADVLSGTDLEAATGTLDTFWMLKHEMYFAFIRSRLGVTSDYLCERYFDDNKGAFRPEDFYLNDRQLAAKFQPLFLQLRELRNVASHRFSGAVSSEEFTYSERRFFVDSSISLDGSESTLARRYLQLKRARQMTSVNFHKDEAEENLDL